MLVHVFRVPQIEGGARTVIHDGGQDWVVFMLEEDITEEGAEALQAAMNTTWLRVLLCGVLPDLGSLLHATV